MIIEVFRYELAVFDRKIPGCEYSFGFVGAGDHIAQAIPQRGDQKEEADKKEDIGPQRGKMPAYPVENRSEELRDGPEQGGQIDFF
jgi:hypothetical protein